MSTSVSKMVAERNRRILMELVLKPGNDVCADCRTRAPRWASYNIGIFICVSCASIHRKIGTHITKVKSITLDEWTKEQVEVMKEKGNVKSNALYNPDEARHPPPTNMTDSERDSELERFIRSKYESRRFMNRKSNSQYLKTDPHAASTPPGPRSTPLTDPARIQRKASPPGPPLPPKTPENLPSRLRPLFTMPSQNAPPTQLSSQPLPPLTGSEKLSAATPLRQQPAAAQRSVQKPAGQVWEDLVSLQEPSQSSSLPLQYSPLAPFTSSSSQPYMSVQRPLTVPNPFTNLSFGQANTTTSLIAGPNPLPNPGSHLPFGPSAPLASPAHHLGAMNPFGQAPPATGSNPFLSTTPVAMAAPTSVQPVMALPTGAFLHTPPVPHVASQMSVPVPVVSFPAAPSPFAPGPATAGLAPNPFAPVGPSGQIPLSATGTTNPFAAVQMGQSGFASVSPQTPFGTTAFLSQQQQLGPNMPGGWAGQGAHGTF